MKKIKRINEYEKKYKEKVDDQYQSKSILLTKKWMKETDGERKIVPCACL